MYHTFLHMHMLITLLLAMCTNAQVIILTAIFSPH